MCAQILSFEGLDCWKAGRDLRRFAAHELVPALPRDEKYRLGDQLLRAARSITANIAEGYGRHHYLDNAKFCRNAMGSCCEVLDHVICAHDEAMISDDLLQQTRDKVALTERLLSGYISYLKRAAAATSGS